MILRVHLDIFKSGQCGFLILDRLRITHRKRRIFVYDLPDVRWVQVIEDIQIQFKVKRLGEGGTQTFDTHILPEISAEIKGSCFELINL